jgi:sugar-specific transcriptional regulator TrmB
MTPAPLIARLQELGFTQYEAQCYLGLLQHHPSNGSQLSTVCGVPRSMVYQTLNRLEEKGAVVRLSEGDGEPHQFEPIAPNLLIAQFATRYQATCEEVEHELAAFTTSPPADVVLNIAGTDAILRRAAILVRQATQHIAVMGGSPELAALEPDLTAATARGVSARMVSIGTALPIQGQIVSYLGDNVSAPTRFLVVIADSAPVLVATFPPDAIATAVFTDNRILARLLLAFLNTEYYIVRLSNQHPALVAELLTQVLEPEDRPRYAGILRFLGQRAAEQP